MSWADSYSSKPEVILLRSRNWIQSNSKQRFRIRATNPKTLKLFNVRMSGAFSKLDQIQDFKNPGSKVGQNSRNLICEGSCTSRSKTQILPVRLPHAKLLPAKSKQNLKKLIIEIWNMNHVCVVCTVRISIITIYSPNSKISIFLL